MSVGKWSGLSLCLLHNIVRARLIESKARYISVHKESKLQRAVSTTSTPSFTHYFASGGGNVQAERGADVGQICEDDGLQGMDEEQLNQLVAMQQQQANHNLQVMTDLADAENWEIASSTLGYVSIVDISGVTGVVSAYAKPVCDENVPFPCTDANLNC